MNHGVKRKGRGFTLIELMITVAIVGILGAIAYPSYIDQVRKSRRSEARSALLQAANRQERFYTTQYTYAKKVDADGFDVPAQTESKFYKIEVDSADATSFQISAVAQKDQVNDDCTKLTINNLGEKTANGEATTAAISQTCW